MAKLLVIIPAYNEEAAILTTLADLQTNCPEADWVVVNDCSRDGTRELLRSSRASYLDLPVNLGIGGGVQTGYKYAVEHGYDLTVQFDGDGQHRADCIRELIAPIVRGEADMTVGSRFLPEAGEQDRGFQSSAARRMGIRWISGLIRLTTGRTIHDVTSGFRACGKELPYVIDPRRPGDIAECYADPAKARDELGWTAEYGIEEMCASSWKWQSMNPNGYKG